MKEKFWCGEGPKVCQICDRPIAEVFVDGRTQWDCWAFMCRDCHETHGEGLGTGKGQLYGKQSDGRWKKIEPSVDQPRNTFNAELADVMVDPFVARLLHQIDNDDFIDYPVTHDGDLDNPVQ
jgi:hypothetical protein